MSSSKEQIYQRSHGVEVFVARRTITGNLALSSWSAQVKLAAVAWVACMFSPLSQVSGQSRPLNIDDFPVWEVDSIPSVKIGGNDQREGYIFSRLGESIFLSGNRIAASDPREQTIKIYDGQGVHVQTLGGRGEGPGEFTGLIQIGRTGLGGIWAWDQSLSRVTVYSNGTRPLTNTRIDPFKLQRRWTRFLGVSSENHFLIRESLLAPEALAGQAGEHRHNQVYYLFGKDGSFLEQIHEAPGLEMFQQESEGSRRSSVSVGNTRDTYASFFDDRLVVATSDSFSFSVLDPEGNLIDTVKFDYDLIALTPEEIANTRVALTIDPETREEVPGTRPPVREVLPAFSDMRVDLDGNIWVELYPRPGAERFTWLIFSQDWVPQGRLEIPRRLFRGRISDVQSTALILVTIDRLGLPTIQVHSIGMAP